MNLAVDRYGREEGKGMKYKWKGRVKGEFHRREKELLKERSEG